MKKITFLGDAMCKSELIQAYYDKGKYDFTSIFSEVKSTLSESDYVFANLETPISLDNSDLTTEQWCFYSPFEFAKAIRDIGINFVATANNHCLDRGISGINSTIKSLERLGLKHTGTFSNVKQREQSSMVKVGTMNIGVLSYTYGTNAFSNHQYLKKSQKYAVNLFQNQELSNPFERYFYYHRKNILAKIYNVLSELISPGQITGPIYEHKEFSYFCKRRCIKDIRKLKKSGVDLIIMYMHAGGQYNAVPTEYTKKLTQWLLKQGVNIVVGSHEHVVHGGLFDYMNHQKLATYSLGNFNGIAGVYVEPMNKMAEYSIAWHVYLDENAKMIKTTFTILKTISLGNGKIQVVPCIDLLKNEDKHSKDLCDDMRKIANIFSGKNISEDILRTNRELDII